MRKLASAYVFLLIGLLLLCWVVPDEVYRIADSMGQRVLYGLAGVRFVLGILLLGAAGSSRMPVFLRVMGVLSICGGVFVLAIGVDGVSGVYSIYGGDVVILRVTIVFAVSVFGVIAFGLGKKRVEEVLAEDEEGDGDGEGRDIEA